MIYSIAYLIFISVGSFFSRKISLLFLISLIPFYTLIREFLGLGFITFIWPYLWISILIFVSIFFKTNEIKIKKFSPIKIFNVLLLILSVFLILSKGASNFSITSISVIFSYPEYVFLVSVVLTYFITFVNIVFKKIKEIEGAISFLDFAILFFILFGFLQIYIGLFIGKDIFNAILGFRYYFSGALIFFLVRLTFLSIRDLKIVLTVVFTTIFISSIFIYTEGILINVLNFEPDSLPWQNGILSQFFGYGHDIRTFIDVEYVPMGIMFMLHLSGVFNLFGFLLLFPFIYNLNKFENKSYKYLVTIWVLLSPLFFIFTSKTTIVLYYGAIFITALFQIKFWKKSLLIIPLFAIVIPTVYSYYLLPGMTQDYGRVISYLVSPQTATTEKSDTFTGSDGDLKKYGKAFFYIGNKNEKVLNNSILDLFSSAVEDVNVNLNILMGHEFKCSDEMDCESKATSILDKNNTEVVLIKDFENVKMNPNLLRILTNQAKQDVAIGYKAQLDKSQGNELEIVKTEIPSGEAKESNTNSELIVLDKSQGNELEIVKTEIPLDNDSNIVISAELLDLIYLDENNIMQIKTQYEGDISSNRLLEASYRDEIENMNVSGEMVDLIESHKSTNQNLNQDPISYNKNTFFKLLFGGGYQISEWNKLNSDKEFGTSDFKLNTKSDTPYINFFFQFGALGLIILISLILFSLLYPFLAFRKSKIFTLKTLSIGIFSLMLIQAIGLIHLQILFKTGLNSVIFIMMALSLRIYALRET